MLAAHNITKKKQFASEVTLAKSLADRMIGLLKHSSLNAQQGLWIKPCRSIHTFFMKFSIDVLFLNSEGNVVKTYQNLKPFRLSTIVFKAHSVLELAAGSIAKNHIEIGDNIIFKSHRKEKP